MSLEEASDSLEGSIEQFKADLDDAEMIAEMGGRGTLEDLPSFDEIRNEEPAIIEVLRERYDFDPNSAPAKVEEIDGTSGTPGEGKIRINIYTTNKADVCIAKYEYADGSHGWSLRPLDFDENA